MSIKGYDEELIKLGRRLQQIRKHRKLTLLKLEILSGINDSDLSRYERGKENIEFHTIYKLAVALEVTVNMLTDYDGPLPNNEEFLGFKNFKSKRKKHLDDH